MQSIIHAMHSITCSFMWSGVSALKHLLQGDWTSLEWFVGGGGGGTKHHNTTLISWRITFLYRFKSKQTPGFLSRNLFKWKKEEGIAEEFWSTERLFVRNYTLSILECLVFFKKANSLFTHVHTYMCTHTCMHTYTHIKLQPPFRTKASVGCSCILLSFASLPASLEVVGDQQNTFKNVIRRLCP